MQLIQLTELESVEPCPYLPGRDKQYEYFLAMEVSAAELSGLLAQGWRKFGPYYFRVACPGCRLCLPLRVDVGNFATSRSQRRLLRKSAAVSFRFGPLRPDEEVYELYRRHSLIRFGIETDREAFHNLFYLSSCPALQSELYLNDRLVGVGFLDRGADALSSVYFSYDPDDALLQPGTLSILAEIEHARRLGLPWYYLGYHVPGSTKMADKNHFRPRQQFDWSRHCWQTLTSAPESHPLVGDAGSAAP